MSDAPCSGVHTPIGMGPDGLPLIYEISDVDVLEYDATSSGTQEAGFEMVMEDD